MANDQDSERNRLLGRVGRTARLGANFSGAGLKMAGAAVFGGDKSDTQIANALAKALGNSKGPLMKLAQLAATVPDLLPEEYTKELSGLQSHAPAMGWPFVRRRMRAELGDDWQEKFSDFGREASFAASLGQVHKATLQDGQTVACKLQYPEMASAVESDVGQMKTVLSLFRRVEKSIDPSEAIDELADRLREELDYEREAKHMALYAKMLADYDFVTIPKPVPQLSTSRLLTMAWLEGERLDSFQTAPQETRNTIAQNLFNTWWHPFNFYGVIHGDPHLGNYQITQGGQALNLLDFGCVRIFPPDFVGGVIDLYHARQTKDMDASFAAYQRWGFDNLTEPLVEALNGWADFMYGPILDDRVRPIAEGVSMVEYGRKEAFGLRQKLKTLGPVTIPREFVYLDRAVIGLGSAYLRLDARLNFHRLFEAQLAQFNQKDLENRQKRVLQEVNL